MPPADASLTDRLRSHLTELAVPRHALKHPENHAKVSAYVRTTLETSGLSVEAHALTFQNQTFHNWIAQYPQEAGNKPLLLIGAHFDSVPNTAGADDNASGTAVLLEAARAYALRRQSGWAPKGVTVQFAAFDLEECDLDGSQAYAKFLSQEQRPVAGMVSLEMVGYTRRDPQSQRYPPGLSWLYPDRGDFIAVVGSLSSFGFFWKVRRAFRSVPALPCQSLAVPGKGRLVPDVRRSDHAPFWDHGFPAVLVTDTSFFRNPYYHSPQDTMDTLNVDFMTHIVEAVGHLIDAYSGTGV